MLVPGPPHECHALFDDGVPAAAARRVCRRAHIAKRTLKAAMIPESQADKLLAPIYTDYTDVETTILAHTGDIQLTLDLLQGPRWQPPSSAWTSLRASWKKRSTTGSTPRRASRWSRSCSTISACGRRRWPWRRAAPAAWLRSASHRVPGSSRSFLGGAVVYSDPLKTSFANVPPELIAQHGAVSAEVASALAEGIRKRTGATLGLGVTGIAGPTGGTEDKPVGLVYFAVSDAQKTDSFNRTFRGDRERVRQWASQQALDLIRRKLM